MSNRSSMAISLAGWAAKANISFLEMFVIMRLVLPPSWAGYPYHFPSDSKSEEEESAC